MPLRRSLRPRLAVPQPCAPLLRIRLAPLLAQRVPLRRRQRLEALECLAHPRALLRRHVPELAHVFAQFAPLVLEHAERGDLLGKAVMEHAAAGAARIAQRLIDVGAPGVALLGGLAAPMTPWLPPAIQARLVKPEADALDGAILLARRSTVAEARA